MNRLLKQLERLKMKKPSWVEEDFQKLAELRKSESKKLPKSKKELAEILQSEPNTQLIAGATDGG